MTLRKGALVGIGGGYRVGIRGGRRAAPLIALLWVCGQWHCGRQGQPGGEDQGGR